MIEPTDVGARVEDGTGARWVRVHRPGGSAPWWRYLVDERDPDSEVWAVWSAIPEPTRAVTAAAAQGELL